MFKVRKSHVGTFRRVYHARYKKGPRTVVRGPKEKKIQGILVHALETRDLDVLEVGRAGRQAVDVEECGVKHPVSFRRVVDMVAALESAVVIVRIKEVDQRT